MKYTHEQIREIIESDFDDADTFVSIIEQLLEEVKCAHTATEDSIS
jgi:hypothetical protein